MAKVKISEFNSNPALNTDIDSINLAEGCAPSGINDAIRELMSQLKDWQSGTSNDPMVIGSTGSLTLNQGTANGVAYLNGSKVVTSGSALTFDGTTLTNANTIKVQTSAGTAPKFWIGQAATGAWSIGSPASVDALVFVNEQFSTESMRLTSTGLGIGTSSPAYKLDVAVGNNARALNIAGATTGYSFVQIANSGGQLVWGVGDGSTGALFGGMTAYASAIGSNNATPFQIATNGTIRATLDSSGNLGLGVTPSAWYSAYKAFQLKDVTSLALFSGGYDANMTCNAIFTGSGSAVYGGASYGASRYNQFNGAHIFYTAPSGTAGNAITFTQVATIDASGNFLVGTTSFSYNPTQGATIAGGSIGAVGIGHASGTASGNGYVNFAYNGSNIGSITQSGTTAVLYNVTSDQRLKENIVDAPEFGSVIDSIQVRSYDWKTDGTHQRAGFIAQELVTVAPEAVHQPEDTEQMMAVDYSKLVPMLVKEIQSLRVRVAQLESN